MILWLIKHNIDSIIHFNNINNNNDGNNVPIKLTDI